MSNKSIKFILDYTCNIREPEMQKINGQQSSHFKIIHEGCERDGDAEKERATKITFQHQ
jgi:hypothetical protein